MELELLPYGKAREEYNEETEKWDFSCQHGKKECRGNLIQTCAIQITERNATRYMPFVNCMEQQPEPLAVSSLCADRHGLNYESIRECVLGSEGNAYQHEIAVKTEELANPLTYVPWIAFDGERNRRAEFDLKQEICAALSNPKPNPCLD